MYAPEPRLYFSAAARIAGLKEALQLNVELAAPDQFIPPLPGWRERSEQILTAGQVEFHRGAEPRPARHPVVVLVWALELHLLAQKDESGEADCFPGAYQLAR